MSNGDLFQLTAVEAAERIAGGHLPTEEYIGACLDRIAALDDKIGAFVHLDRAHALRQARALDERRASGLPTGPLHGVPVAVKDIVDTADFPTEHGSPVYSGRRPSRDATVVARMRAAGAVIIGKTVTAELAYSHPGRTRNPRDLERTPGGSSSGSAAAVAAGMVPLAIGTQTNGSMIRPAAFCGVYGVKPSHGSISRAGMLSHSRLLDQPGVFARTLDDMALLLDVIVGHDPNDPDTRPVAAPAFRRIAAEKPPLAPRYAFMPTPIWGKADADTHEAFEALVDRLGDAVDRVELPAPFTKAAELQRTIMAADMAHHHSIIADRAGDLVSPIFRDFIAAGRKIAAVDYLAAIDAAKVLGSGTHEYFTVYDAIITPAAKGVAPRSLETTGDPAFCTLWTLLGMPSLSLPILEGEDNLPLGVQLVGPVNDDARLLRTAADLLRTLTGKRARKGARKIR
jgi:Asp-tRNA(Asn)/Glu-tRNA(Gln) amidotransferase A subunit family amidase